MTFPPGPPVSQKRLPLPRLAARLLKNPIEIWAREHFEEFVVDETSPLGRRLVISDPQIVGHVLVDNAANYRRDRVQSRLIRRVTGDGIFSSEGDAWRSQRRAMAPTFTPQALQAYVPAMEKVADEAVARFEASGAAGADVHAHSARIALAMIAATLFPEGLGGDSLEQTVADVGAFSRKVGRIRVADLLQLPAAWPSLEDWKCRQTVRSVRRRSRAIVDHSRSGEAKCPVADALVAAARNGSPSVSEATRIEDNISVLLGAGSDTTAASLAWTIILLAGFPDMRNRIAAEADDVRNGFNAARMPYTRAAIEEAMRLYPPAPTFGRTALQTETVRGLTIAKGTDIIIAPWVMHRHRKLWNAPDDFQPERFLPQNRGSIARHAYLPFGAGPKICLGAQFAMQEMMLVISRLCAALDFGLIEGQRLEPRQYITLQPANDYRVAFRPRGTNVRSNEPGS